MSQERLTVWVSGTVQGVGFRWWVRARALELGLVGWARNCADGRVEVVAEGPREACDQLQAALDVSPPPSAAYPQRPGVVRVSTARRSDPKGLDPGFRER